MIKFLKNVLILTDGGFSGIGIIVSLPGTRCGNGLEVVIVVIGGL